MDDLNEESVAHFYNNKPEIWAKADRWHAYTKKQIFDFVYQAIGKIRKDVSFDILNAGSGGSDYGIEEQYLIHLDIAENKIKDKPRHHIASILDIPLPDSSVDAVICVGSVINYSKPVSAFPEFKRILKPGGFLILEYETTDTLEYKGTDDFGKAVSLNQTFYNKEKVNLKLFSQKYIENHLVANQFEIKTIKRFHILSPWIYKKLKNENVASYFSIFDKMARYIPLINKTCSNCILIAEKIS